jgi:pimeloyl-ACP methyl ester carboxylesterase
MMDWLLVSFVSLVSVLLSVIVLMMLFTVYAARKVETTLPPIGSFVDLDEARLHIVERGQGPPVLLIHGIAGNLRHFTYSVADLLAPHYRVIAVDRPGCGYSTRTAGAESSLQAQADTMARLLDTLQIERAVIVGHSLGGALALALAQRHPQRVAALALVAPLTHLPTEVSPAFKALAIRKNWLRKTIAWTLAVPVTIASSKVTLELVFGPEAVPKDFATRGGGLLALRPGHFMTASTDLNAIPAGMATIEAGYAAMQLPVHVLYGRGDRILSHQENGEDLMARLPGSQLTLMDGGHMLPVTQPAATADFIQGVMRQVFTSQQNA